MKRLILWSALALCPVATVSAYTLTPFAAVAASSDWSNMSSLQTIAADTQTLVNAADLKGAEKRITDFETEWDGAESTMRPQDVARWTAVDHAADKAIESLRADAPSQAEAAPAVGELVAILQSPAAPAPSATAATPVAAFSMTNADGSPVPCETALEELRRVSADVQPAAADQAKFDELQTKGIERCNADDDKRADDFFAQALAILGH